MSKHPHAENMALYAQDAMETDVPWNRWECSRPGRDDWVALRANPLWEFCMEYRRKPRKVTRTIEYSVPAMEPLEKGQEYFASLVGGVRQFTGGAVGPGSIYSRGGVVFLTREDAEEHHRQVYRLPTDGEIQ